MKNFPPMTSYRSSASCINELGLGPQDDQARETALQGAARTLQNAEKRSTMKSWFRGALPAARMPNNERQLLTTTATVQKETLPLPDTATYHNSTIRSE